MSLLEGKYFKDLQLKLQERIEDTQLTLYVLDAKAPERAKLDIFERVNSGEPLTRQQMRNCLYNGEATRWLRTAAESRPFQQATGGRLDRNKMRDREVINRFCAFKLLGWDSYRSGDMDTFLAEALDRMNEMSTESLDDLRAQFVQSMNNNFQLFKHHAFRKSLAKPLGSRSVINIALFDVCSTVLSNYAADEIDPFKEQIVKKVQALIGDSGFQHAITYSTNSTKQVRTRFVMMHGIIREVIG